MTYAVEAPKVRSATAAALKYTIFLGIKIDPTKVKMWSWRWENPETTYQEEDIGWKTDGLVTCFSFRPAQGLQAATWGVWMEFPQTTKGGGVEFSLEEPMENFHFDHVTIVRIRDIRRKARHGSSQMPVFGVLSEPPVFALLFRTLFTVIFRAGADIRLWLRAKQWRTQRTKVDDGKSFEGRRRKNLLKFCTCFKICRSWSAS